MTKKKKNSGKQFSSTYQPPEKWTEEKALKLGNELIKWLKDNPKEMFFEKFFLIEKDLYHDITRYLCDKFASFSALIDKAKKIQVMRLKDYGVKDLLNATMTKFVLINNHGWADKTNIDHTTKGKEIQKEKEVVYVNVPNLKKPDNSEE